MPNLPAHVKAMVDSIKAAPLPPPKMEEKLFVEKVPRRELMEHLTPERNRLPESSGRVLKHLQDAIYLNRGDAYLITNPKKQVVGLIIPDEKRWWVLGRNIAISVSDDEVKLPSSRDALPEFSPGEEMKLEIYGPEKYGTLAVDFSDKTRKETQLSVEAEGTMQATISHKTRHVDMQVGDKYYHYGPRPIHFTLRASDEMIREADIADRKEEKHVTFRTEGGLTTVRLRSATQFVDDHVTNASFNAELMGSKKRIPLFEYGEAVSVAESKRLQKQDAVSAAEKPVEVSTTLPARPAKAPKR